MKRQTTCKIIYPIYHFLPCATTHIHRVMRFLNHLVRTEKYDITVLTCKNPNDILYDDNLIKELDPRIKIVRTQAILFGLHNKSGIAKSYLAQKHEHNRASWLQEALRKIYKATLREFFNLLNVPDNCIGWLPFAYMSGRKLMVKQVYDIILTTGPPFTNFVLAALLRTSSTKLVLDYRDPWKNNYYMEQTFRATWQARLSRNLETFVLKRADIVIANTERMRDFILSQNPKAFSARNITTEVIYNGYDFSPKKLSTQQKKSQLVFLHSGRFHGKYRTPKYLLKAMRELIDSGEVASNEIKMVFLGNIKPSDFDLFADIKTDDFCTFMGMVPHAENLRLLEEADCLVVLGGGAKWDGMFVPSKIYEYLQTNNTIMGLLPDGEALEILRKAQGSVLASPDNIMMIKEAILNIYRRFQKCGNLKITRDWSYLIKNFDAAEQSEKLQTILESLHRPSTTIHKTIYNEV